MADPVPVSPEPRLVVRPLDGWAGAGYLVVGGGTAALLIPTLVALAHGSTQTFAWAGLLVGWLLMVGLLRRFLHLMVITVDDVALRWPGGRVREIPRDRIATITRRLVGECVVDTNGRTLTVLPNILTRRQVGRIAEALGVPHLDKHGRELRG